MLKLANPSNTTNRNFDAAWNHLEHSDQILRFVSRSNVEKTPVSKWVQKVLADENSKPQVILESTMALARAGGNLGTDIQDKVSAKLASLKWNDLSLQQRHHLLRNFGLVMMRMGSPTEHTRNTVAKLAQYFPVASTVEGHETLNRELSRLLIAADQPKATGKTLALLQASEAQHMQVHFAMVLSVAQIRLDSRMRNEYFQWFLEATDFQGGNSFGGYLKNIRQRAIDSMSDEDKNLLAEVLAKEPKAVDLMRT